MQQLVLLKFSHRITALGRYEDRVKTKVDLLMERLGKVESCNITQESILYSFDVMGDIALSKDFNMLRYVHFHQHSTKYLNN
jgi:hypothetical protein